MSKAFDEWLSKYHLSQMEPRPIPIQLKAAWDACYKYVLDKVCERLDSQTLDLAAKDIRSYMEMEDLEPGLYWVELKAFPVPTVAKYERGEWTHLDPVGFKRRATPATVVRVFGAIVCPIAKAP